MLFRNARPVALAPTPTRSPGRRARTRACTPSRPGTPKLPLRRLRTSSPRYRSHPRLRAASPFDKPACLVGRLGGAERAREEPEASLAHADLACLADDGEGGKNAAYCRVRALFDALVTDGHAALACYASAPADVFAKRDAGVPPCVCVRRRRSGHSRAVHARVRWVARCVSTGACVRAAIPACLLQSRGLLVFVDAEHTPPYRTCYPAQLFARCSLSFQSRRG